MRYSPWYMVYMASGVRGQTVYTHVGCSCCQTYPCFVECIETPQNRGPDSSSCVDCCWAGRKRLQCAITQPHAAGFLKLAAFELSSYRILDEPCLLECSRKYAVRRARMRELLDVHHRRVRRGHGPTGRPQQVKLVASRSGLVLDRVTGPLWVPRRSRCSVVPTRRLRKKVPAGQILLRRLFLPCE